LIEPSKHEREKAGLPTKKGFLLTEEVKPNGNRLLFHYTQKHGRHFLSRVQTKNPTDTAILNQLNFEYEPDLCKVKSSCGNRIEYTFKHHHDHKNLVSVNSSQMAETTYQNNDSSYPRIA